jgi:hypothetical protein
MNTARSPIAAIIESLESRQFLSVAPIVATGTYAGTLTITAPSGSSGTQDVLVLFDSESKSGAVTGAIDFANLGSFTFTGQVTGRSVKLKLQNNAGTVSGAITANKLTFTGSFSQGAIRGHLGLGRQVVTGQTISHTANGTILVSNGIALGVVPITNNPSNNPPGLPTNTGSASSGSGSVLGSTTGSVLGTGSGSLLGTGASINAGAVVVTTPSTSLFNSNIGGSIVFPGTVNPVTTPDLNPAGGPAALGVIDSGSLVGNVNSALSINPVDTASLANAIITSFSATPIAFTG